jgi:hypothetical protein
MHTKTRELTHRCDLEENVEEVQVVECRPDTTIQTSRLMLMLMATIKLSFLSPQYLSTRSCRSTRRVFTMNRHWSVCHLPAECTWYRYSSHRHHQHQQTIAKIWWNVCGGGSSSSSSSSSGWVVGGDSKPRDRIMHTAVSASYLSDNSQTCAERGNGLDIEA